MSSSNWNIVKSNKQNTTNTETYFLLDILDNGGCMRCMNKTCKNTDRHGIQFPEKICTFIQNPTYINGISNAIKEAKLNFNNKTPFYTTCNYINGNCRNCEAQRVKHIIFNNEKITLCYPDLSKIKYKVTIGLHIDIKLTLKGNKFDVYAIPINIMRESEKPSVKDVVKDTTSLTEENFPSFNPSIIESNDTKVESNTEINKVDFSIIKTNVEKQEVLSKKYKEDEDKKRIHISISKDIKKDDNESILEENIILRKKINSLLEINKLLDEKNKRSSYIIENSTHYDDILSNINKLNTSITQQFMTSNYRDYILA
jgi:hypothetical protein